MTGRATDAWRAAVIGSPIAHSRSPELHAAAYAALGLRYQYDAIEVGAGTLDRFVGSLGPEWLGLSVTMPLKAEALALAVSADAHARRCGAANTLVPTGAGWHALNTDVAGFVDVLRALVAKDAPGEPGRPVVVLGGGATARAALVAIDELADAASASDSDPGAGSGTDSGAGSGAGSGTVADVVVVVRSPTRAPAADALGVRTAIRVGTFDDPGIGELLAEARVVVNTTPPGAVDRYAVTLPETLAGAYVDVVYDPWPTPLARAWAIRGGVVRGGLELLVAQAAGQVLAMTGREVARSVLRHACGLSDDD